MITSKEVIKTIEGYYGIQLPKTGLLAGGAVANTIAYLEGATSKLIINDIDIFRQATLAEQNKLLANVEQKYLGMIKLITTERDGAFNYVSRVDCHDMDSLLESFDINCCQAGINLETESLTMTRAYEEFLQSKQIQVIAFHSAGTTIARVEKKAKQLGVYYSKTQIEAIKAFMSQAREGTVTWKDVKFWVESSAKRNRFVKEEIAFMERIAMCSKTQKKNIMNFIGSSERAGSIMKEIINLLLQERQEISPELLNSVKKTVVGEHKNEFRYMLRDVIRHKMTFKGVAETVMTAKKLSAKYNFVWGLFGRRDITDAKTLRKAVAETLRSTTDRWPALYLSKQVETSEFTIKELTRAMELLNEGGEMGHCVGGYSSSCKQSGTRIFAVKMKDGSRYTLETNIDRSRPENKESRLINQFKGKRNEQPKDSHYVKVINYLKTIGVGTSQQLVEGDTIKTKIW